MSQSPTTPSLSTQDQPPAAKAVVESEPEIQDVMDAFDDRACRDILDATGEAALSAKEIAETCDLAVSTCYRKLDQLTEAGLLTERTRIRRSGKHASEYVRAVDEVTVTLQGGDGVRLEVADADPDDGRLR